MEIVCATAELEYWRRRLVHARKSRRRVGFGRRSAQATVEWYPPRHLELLRGVSITQHKSAMANPWVWEQSHAENMR